MYYRIKGEHYCRKIKGKKIKKERKRKGKWVLTILGGREPETSLEHSSGNMVKKQCRETLVTQAFL